MERLRDRPRRVVDLQAAAHALLLELNGCRVRGHHMLGGAGNRLQPWQQERHVCGGAGLGWLDPHGHGPVARPVLTASPALGRQPYHDVPPDDDYFQRVDDARRRLCHKYLSKGFSDRVTDKSVRNNGEDGSDRLLRAGDHSILTIPVAV